MVIRKINTKKKKHAGKKKKIAKIKFDNPNGREDFERALQNVANYPYPEKK